MSVTENTKHTHIFICTIHNVTCRQKNCSSAVFRIWLIWILAGKWTI